jgi:hypothetical protein
MTCDICHGNKRIRLPTYPEMTVDPWFDDIPSVSDRGWKEFDCPQCTPMVPYRRVRALKVATAYEAEQFAKFQTPIERMLAARFGEYLMREGLIKFTTSGSTDFGRPSGKITITAHLGVVSREDVKRAEIIEEVALTGAPPLPKKLTRQEQERTKVSPRAVRWTPKPPPWPDADEPVTDEFDEPRGAISKRFSGLEI